MICIVFPIALYATAICGSKYSVYRRVPRLRSGPSSKNPSVPEPFAVECKEFVRSKLIGKQVYEDTLSCVGTTLVGICILNSVVNSIFCVDKTIL